MSELVSIIIPVYNMEKSLEKSVMSLLEQEYRNIEIILVDDGSTDGSYEICEKLYNSDQRVKCIHTDNQGAGLARNKGLELCSGKYIYFPDADDYLEKNAIKVLVEAMENGKYDLIVFGYRTLSCDGKLISERSYNGYEDSGEHIRKNYSTFFGMENKYSIQGAPWNKFFDSDVIKKNHIVFPSLRREQDEGFISRYVSHCNNIRFVSDVLYMYFQNSIRLEWKKYPIDYLSCVNGLNEIWRETICTWNPQDKRMQKIVNQSIFEKKIKVLELSFSPKLKLNYKTRKKWIEKVCVESSFYDYEVNIADNPYDKALLMGAKKQLYGVMSCLMYLRILKKKIC